MTELIKDIMKKQYESARKTVRVMFVVSTLILILPFYYEYSIGFIHVRFNFVAFYVVLIWLSGVCFGYALLYRFIMKKIEKIF